MIPRRIAFPSLVALAGLVLALGVAVSPAQALEPAPTVTPKWTTHDRARVDWTAVRGAAYYRVTYSLDPVVSSGVTKKIAKSSPIVLGSLQSNKTYYVRVLAITANSVPVSGWSAIRQFKTKPPPVNVQVGTYNVKNPRSDNPAPWATRKPLIAKAILSQRMTVLGLQELYRESGRKELLAEVNTLAGGDFYAMTEEPDSDGGFDNRILYDKRRVELVDFGSEIYPAARQAPGDTKRWWTWATFRHKAGSRPTFLFANTHLSPDSDEVDVLQWVYLAYQVKKIGQAKKVPVIIVGDFNSTKFEPPSKDMLKHMYSSGFGDVLGQTYRSYSTYRPRAKQKIDAWIGSSNRGRLDMRTFSVSKDRNSNSIDWVFASNHLQVPRYRVYAQYAYPYLKSPLPSDHQLVTAVISLP